MAKLLLFFCLFYFSSRSVAQDWSSSVEGLPNINTNPGRNPFTQGKCSFVCQGACPAVHKFAQDENNCHVYPCHCVEDEELKLFQNKRVGKVLENDMVVKASQVDLIERLYGKKPLPRSIFSIERFYWKTYKKNGYYYVPYVVDSSITDSIIMKNIPAAVREFRQRTCVRFIRRTNQQNYVRFRSDDGCYAHIGMTGGAQTISLENGGCAKYGTTVHEMMHALGFFHEQSRPDRDEYIKIRKANVRKGQLGNFNKMTASTSLGSPYDYGSVMHYKLNAFSKNGRDTIATLKKTTADVGQREGFSDVDIDQINRLYPCKRFAAPSTTKQPTTTTPPTTAHKVCEDQFKSCSSWQSKGYCKEGNPFYQFALKYCNATCAFCVKPASAILQECKDEAMAVNCKTWLDSGYCTHKIFGDAVKSRCQKTCGICGIEKDLPVKKNSPPDAFIVIHDDTCGVTSVRQQHFRIVGGEIASHGAHPWQVNLRFEGDHSCGATLLNRQWLVTAAHCIRKTLHKYTAILGGHYKYNTKQTERVVRFSKVIRHPGFDPNTMENDIALLKMSDPVQYTKYIRPICLSSESPTEIDEITVTGWGSTENTKESNEELRMATIPVINRRSCNKLPWRTADHIYPGMFCAGYKDGHKDSCRGDSGGPAVMLRDGYYQLVGVISWGFGCAGKYSPGVYSNVYDYKDWMQSTIRHN